MATVNKDFRVKHGLVVEGSTATVNGSNVLTESSTEFLQDTVAAMVDGSHTNLTVAYNDTTGKLTFTAENGVADSTTSDLAEGTNLYFTDERAQDAVGNVVGTGLAYNDTTGAISTSNIPNSSLENSTITVNGFSISLGGSQTISTKDISENTNLYFTNERVDDRVNDLLTAGTGLTKTYDDPNGTLTVAIDSTVTTNSGSQTLTNKSIALGSNTVTGTLAQLNTAISDADVASLAGSETLTNKTINLANNTLQTTLGQLNSAISDADVATLSGIETLTNKSLGSGTTLISNLDAGSKKIINLAAPDQATDAATKAYVDSVTEGLHIHASAVAATTTNINLSTDLENGDVLDGVTLVTGDRVLVKNQNTASQNGIYVVQASGAAVRATDFDAPAEVDGGDFIFVTGGTINNDTGWVQTSELVSVIGTDPIYFTQFSGAGTYLAGTGLTLTGNTFSINTTVTADVSTAQTFSNKSISLGSNTVSGTLAQFNTALTDADFASLAGSETLTNKSVNLANNTLTGTLAQFNTALSDADFASLAGTETLTNKSMSGSNNTFTNIPNSALSNSSVTVNSKPVSLGSSVTLNTDDISEVAPATNLWFTDERAVDAVAQAIANGTQTNITITYDDAGNKLSFNASGGVSSIAGTTDQVIASASTGAVTLSLPQSIATTSSPTFAGVTAGSLTLTDALIGTAVQSLTDSSATVVDSWTATAYNSAKYVVQMKKGSDIEVLEVLVTVDGNNNVYLTEYADVISNTQLGTTDADFSGGSVRLLVTASNGTTVKVHKTLIEA